MEYMANSNFFQEIKGPQHSYEGTAGGMKYMANSYFFQEIKGPHSYEGTAGGMKNVEEFLPISTFYIGQSQSAGVHEKHQMSGTIKLVQKICSPSCGGRGIFVKLIVYFSSRPLLQHPSKTSCRSCRCTINCCSTKEPLPFDLCWSGETERIIDLY